MNTHVQVCCSLDNPAHTRRQASVHTQTHTYTYTYTHTHTHTNAWMEANTSPTHRHTCTQKHTQTHTYTSTKAPSHTQENTNTHTNKHTHTHKTLDFIPTAVLEDVLPCVCVRVCACVRACVRACVCVCVLAIAPARVQSCKNNTCKRCVPHVKKASWLHSLMITLPSLPVRLSDMHEKKRTHQPRPLPLRQLQKELPAPGGRSS